MILSFLQTAQVAYDASQEVIDQLAPGTAGPPWEQLVQTARDPYIAEAVNVAQGTADPISPIDPTVGPDNATKADIVFRAIVNAVRNAG